MEKVLIISDSEKDREEIISVIGNNHYDIRMSIFNEKVDQVINEDEPALILADYDLIQNRIDIFFSLQQSKSKACLILYGNGITTDELSHILQNGIYAYIPRNLFTERLRETILGGLENRRSFIEILRMMDELKELNSNLETEKEALKKRNQELSFINRLTSEISYDVNWDQILKRMIDAGIEKTLEYRLFGLFFKMGSRWKLSMHMKEPKTIAAREDLISKIIDRVGGKYNMEVPAADVDFDHVEMKQLQPLRLDKMKLIPLDLGGRTLGFIIYEAGNSQKTPANGEVLINTIANMLSLSLKNAQEYRILKEAAVTDNLTGVYNRKGLFDFLEKELSRAERYNKSISFVMTDMDGFKGINDTMGHQAGDYVLREFASILKNATRQPDIISRFGGDEFSILLPETDLNDAHAIMIRVIENLRKHTFKWGSNRFRLNFSYGIANSKELSEEKDTEELIRLADLRLYEDKTSRSKSAA